MQQEHGGNIEEVSRLYDIDREEIIDFSASINFLGPPVGLLSVLEKEMEKIIHYPPSNSGQLKRVLADFLNLEQENVVVGNGAAELIYEIVKTINPEVTLIPVPAFGEYNRAVKSLSGQVKNIYLQSEKQFSINLEKISTYFSEVQLLFLCNPHNPTGRMIAKSKLLNILKQAEKEDVFVVVDEAFMDFVDEEENSVLELVENYSNLFVLRSMTKFYAIPGLRLGYGVGNSEIVAKIENYRNPWTVNSLACRAGRFVLGKEDYRIKTKERVKQERKFLFQKLGEIEGFHPFTPVANYIFIDISEFSLKAKELTEILAQRGILIRNCDSYQGLQDDYIRLAVKSREENMAFLREVQNI